MKKLLFVLMSIFVILFICGCSNNTRSNRNVEVPNVIKNIKSESIDVDVYLDGTCSMGGYVNFSSRTVYEDAVKNIERSISTNWKKENIQYIKFGDTIKPLSRDQFLQFSNSSFYQETDTSLQAVVNSMNPEKLNILITDLFQTNQDIDSLMLALKNNCFSDNTKAMALIGVKSQFNGKIYDIGKSSYMLSYKSGDEKTSYRPFYVLAIGKEADVREFTKVYSKNLDSDLVKVALFSKNLSDDVVLVPGKAMPNNNKEKISNMAQISTMLGSNSDILQYRLNLDKENPGFNATLVANDVVGSLPKEFSVFTCNVERWEQNTEAKKNNSFFDKVLGKDESSGSNTSAAKFTEFKSNDFVAISSERIGSKDGGANVDVLFKFNPSGIRKTEGKYRLNIALLPSKEVYVNANSIFGDWNLVDEDINSQEKAQAVGAKTLHINDFVKMVGSLNYEMNQPGFYNIYIYLEAIK